MKRFFKKHVGLIVLLVIILAFPASMSTQARLNMRIIITGLAVDKTDDGYEVTAQIVKTTPGSESSGTGATINFISDTLYNSFHPANIKEYISAFFPLS